jgi:hypothetical protein
MGPAETLDPRKIFQPMLNGATVFHAWESHPGKPRQHRLLSHMSIGISGMSRHRHAGGKDMKAISALRTSVCILAE